MGIENAFDRAISIVLWMVCLTVESLVKVNRSKLVEYMISVWCVYETLLEPLTDLDVL